MKTFTIKQIKNWLNKQDSFGDCFYNLTEEKIESAQFEDSEKSWEELYDDELDEEYEENFRKLLNS